MNCIILLLLLSCCGGWGNGGSCCNERSNNNCCSGRNNDACCGMRDMDMGRRGPDRRPDRRPEECCCEEEKSFCEKPDCDCERNERENCDVSGMVPPPWQEYPGLPRRDVRNENDCDS